jgi:hypothetical protein
MAKEILDAAVVQQFKQYLTKKNLVYDQLSQVDLKKESTSFLQDKYPGAKQPPNKMVELMTAPSAEKSLASGAVLNPEDEKTCNSNTSKKRKKRATTITCDTGWFKNLWDECYKFFPEPLKRAAASTKCMESAATLPRLILGTRFIVLYDNLKTGQFQEYCVPY